MATKTNVEIGEIYRCNNTGNRYQIIGKSIYTGESLGSIHKDKLSRQTDSKEPVFLISYVRVPDDWTSKTDPWSLAHRLIKAWMLNGSYKRGDKIFTQEESRFFDHVPLDPSILDRVDRSHAVTLDECLDLILQDADPFSRTLMQNFLDKDQANKTPTATAQRFVRRFVKI